LRSCLRDADEGNLPGDRAVFQKVNANALIFVCELLTNLFSFGNVLSNGRKIAVQCRTYRHEAIRLVSVYPRKG
jgi:hypothetical protein